MDRRVSLQRYGLALSTATVAVLLLAAAASSDYPRPASTDSSPAAWPQARAEAAFNNSAVIFAPTEEKHGAVAGHLQGQGCGLIGDVAGNDGQVNAADLQAVAGHWRTYAGGPGWDETYDLVRDDSAQLIASALLGQLKPGSGTVGRPGGGK